MSERSLNEQNVRALRYFVAAHVTVFFVVVASSIPAKVAGEWSAVARSIGPWAVVSSFVVILLLGNIPTALIYSVVFHRVRNALPGHRAFSVYVYRDPRIDVPRLTARIGSFPTESKQQNARWYSLYVAHESDARVSGAHRRFLLMRDATGLSIAVLVILWGFILVVARPEAVVTEVYGLVCLLQTILLSVATRRYAESFVCDVLALSSTESPQ
jgi:hypothetical protein